MQSKFELPQEYRLLDALLDENKRHSDMLIQGDGYTAVRKQGQESGYRAI